MNILEWETFFLQQSGPFLQLANIAFGQGIKTQDLVDKNHYFFLPIC